MLQIIQSDRPLLVAIGPTASAELRSSDRWEELRHVDQIAIDGEPHYQDAGLDILEQHLVAGRNAVAFMFDVRDEEWLDVPRLLAPLHELACTLPVFVRRDPRPGARATPAETLRLSRELGACVIEAPKDGDSLVRTALVPIIALPSPGVMCFHLEDLVALLRPASAARTAICWGKLSELAADSGRWDAVRSVLSDPLIAHVFALVRYDANTTLHAISDMCARLESLAPPSASIMVASTEARSDHIGDVDILVVHNEGGSIDRRAR